MPKKKELAVNEAMKEQEDALYESYKAATRKLLVKHNAEDLLSMLGLEETINDN